MKGKTIKRIMPLIIVAALLVGAIQLGGLTIYASGNSFSNYPLSADGGVKASYNHSSKVLTITGQGTILYEHWKTMAQQINANYFSESFPEAGWRDDTSENSMKIIFNGGSKAIKLPNCDSVGGLFENYSGKISFNGAVGLSPSAHYLSNMFANAPQFNEPVDWDMSNVSNVEYMFYEATSFNQPVDWDTSNFSNINGIFYGATTFDQPVNWNTSEVQNMAYAFAGATSFNQPVNWNTTNVEYMDSMFQDATSFNQPINFDTSSVIDISEFLSGATSFKQPISFDVSNFSNLKDLLKNTAVENVIIDNNGNNVLNAEGIFEGCNSLKHLEFNGLENVAINQFAADYIVVKAGAAPVTRTASTSYTFTDDSQYRVYLQSVSTDDISSCTIEAPASQIYTGYPLTPDCYITYDEYTDLNRNIDYILRYKQNTERGIATVTINGIGNYHGQEVRKFGIGQALSYDNKVIAYYDDLEKELVISGEGQIEFVLWKAMARRFYAQNFTSGQGWQGTEDFDIRFTSEYPQMIKLPYTSVRLFQDFDGKINFGDAVATAHITNMSAMFRGVESFTAPVRLDVTNAVYLVELFWGSNVKSVTLNNPANANNDNIDATDAFKNCFDLEYLEFNGLKNASIDGFSANYYVEADGGSPIVKLADEGYDFTDNLHYKVYLRPELTITAPTINLSKAGSAIKVSWSAVDDATGYQVFRADAAAGPYTLFKTTSELSYTNSGALVPGMPYFYKVRAYNKEGAIYTFSDYSAVKGTYAPGALAKPAAPSLTLDENAGGIRLNWNNQPRITGYQIFRGVSTDKPFSYLKTTSGLAQVYTNISGLNSGRPYYYKIRAYRTADGVTKYGDFSTIKGLFAGTNEPALNAVDFNLSKNAAVNVPNVRVTWTGVSGADGYCVYRWDSVHKNWIGLKATGPNARVYTNINGVVSGKTFFYGMRPLHISGGTTYYGNIGQAKGYKVE